MKRSTCFFKLGNLYSPALIVPIYWALLAASVANAAWAALEASDWIEYLVAAVMLVFGVVSSRIFCELILVPFRILKALEKDDGPPQ